MFLIIFNNIGFINFKRLPCIRLEPQHAVLKIKTLPPPKKNHFCVGSSSLDPAAQNMWRKCVADLEMSFENKKMFETALDDKVYNKIFYAVFNVQNTSSNCMFRKRSTNMQIREWTPIGLDVDTTCTVALFKN